MKLAILALAISAHLFGQSYDVVLATGRVIDPESNLEAVRNVGIRPDGNPAVPRKVDIDWPPGFDGQK